MSITHNETLKEFKFEVDRIGKEDRKAFLVTEEMLQQLKPNQGVTGIIEEPKEKKE